MPKKCRHLLQTSDLSVDEIKFLLEKASRYSDDFNAVSLETKEKMQDKIIVALFFENSTRTVSSFEIASLRLGAKFVKLNMQTSSTSKGETLIDTFKNIHAMQPSAMIMRHAFSSAPFKLVEFSQCPLINAGSGVSAHPTQALLDLLTIYKHFGNKLENLKGKKIAFIGDVKNSRVANSNIKLLQRFGLEMMLCAPSSMLPTTSLRTTHKIEEALEFADIIMSLRTQTERHNTPIFASLQDYGNTYCITKERLEKYAKNKEVIILHPGPVHRDIDIESAMLEDERCKVLEQVKNGVAIRMAVLEFLLASSK
ncbi:aspartate carbamoyltransferase [Helicobacter cetorum]|uniref:Aspartate carbamoyltransferase n=1 Tax=Helicobacter cetorum (strain ATCC BAA-429 / MIT 00-7128) TaxID=182217 RepID=I0ENV1_HELC0|nr:aspartate carbamoyltransferase [Helicobacter cetorum]AFI04620.1 aspartate carbamoyltransferase catalytic subunit [Helicobacter cetorum MIT 00-7128]